MLKAYLDHGLFDQAKDLFQKMSEDRISSKSENLHRVTPDSHTFNLMLEACIQQKRWDEFEDVYGRMLHLGFHFNAKRHLRMILDAARAGKVFRNNLSITRILRTALLLFLVNYHTLSTVFFTY